MSAEPERVPVREVLVLRYPDGADEMDRTELESAAVDLMNVTGATVLCLSPGQTLETLDVEEMRAAGWVRAAP